MDQHEQGRQDDSLIEHIIVRTMTMLDRLVLRERCMERHEMIEKILERQEKRMWGMVITGFFQALAAIGVLLVLLLQLLGRKL